MIVFGFVSLLWLLVRTGMKPSRINYPCQQAALANTMAAFPALATLILGLTIKTHRFLNRRGKILGLILLIGSLIFVIEPLWCGDGFAIALNASQEVNLNLSNSTATLSPASDIFAINGRQIANVSKNV